MEEVFKGLEEELAKTNAKLEAAEKDLKAANDANDAANLAHQRVVVEMLLRHRATLLDERLVLRKTMPGPRLTKLEDDVREIKQGQARLLEVLERQESSRASSSSRSDRTGKNVEDRKQKKCKENAWVLYECPPAPDGGRYCHATGVWWAKGEVVASHITPRSWHCRGLCDYKKAGLDGEWDPKGVMFFLKAFEIEYDRGKVVLVWSGLDDTERDMYNIKVLDASLKDKQLSKDNDITFGKVDGTAIKFLGAARPSRRAINLHASWATKKMSGTASDVVSQSLPESVWSGGSWKKTVEDWMESWPQEV